MIKPIRHVDFTTNQVKVKEIYKKAIVSYGSSRT